MKSVALTEIELHYIEKGDPGNVAVILVHGSLNDYRSWRYQLDRFATRYHVIAYSRRNHYPNDWTAYPSNYSVQTECDDLVDFIQSIGLRTPVHIIGSSYGAFIAALVGRDHPELVRSLVLGEPPIFSLLTEGSTEVHGSGAELEKKFADEVLKPLREHDTKAAAAGFIDSVEGEGAFDRLPPSIREMILENSSSLEAELSKPERDRFSGDDARRIRAPSLLIEGQYTQEVYRTVITSLAEKMPHATVVTIPKASHTPYNANPEAYNDAAMDFLRSH